MSDEAEESREGPRGVLNTIFKGLYVALCVMKRAPSPFLKMDLRQKKKKRKDESR